MPFESRRNGRIALQGARNGHGGQDPLARSAREVVIFGATRGVPSRRGIGIPHGTHIRHRLRKTCRASDTNGQGPRSASDLPYRGGRGMFHS